MSIASLRLAALSSLLAIAGCAPPEAPASPVDPPAPSEPPPVVSAAAEPPAPPPPPKSPFFVHAETERELTLWPVEGGLFVQGGPLLAPVEGGKVTRDDRYAKGLPTMFGMSNVFGAYPKDVHAAVIGTNGRTGWGELYDLGASGWEHKGANLKNSWVYQGVSKWSGGRYLALTTWGMAFDNKIPPAAFKIVSGSKAPVPEITRGSGDCPIKVYPWGFRALESGHVFAIGGVCGQEGKLAIEHWEPGATKSTIVELPFKVASSSGEGATFVGKADDLWVTGGATAVSVLAHYDGKAWTPVSAPDNQALDSLSLAPDGTLWGVTSSLGQLFRRSPDGQWSRVPLPIDVGKDKPMAARNVYADADQVWVTAGGALLSTKAAGDAPQKLDIPNAGTQIAGRSIKIPKAATPSCESVFALFYQFTKVTPPDFDFPLTRKGLKGQTQFEKARFAVVQDNGVKYFGAFVDDFKLGQRMVERVKSEVKGSAPQLLCAKPEVLKEMKIDLRSGDVVR